MTVFLILLESPALVIGVSLAKRGETATRWGLLLHEVLAGKSLVLLLGGLAMGWAAGPAGIAPLDKVFFDLFKGLLPFFLLEMGMVAARRFDGDPGVRILSMTGDSKIAAMEFVQRPFFGNLGVAKPDSRGSDRCLVDDAQGWVFSSPPQFRQCFISISNSRLNRRVQ